MLKFVDIASDMAKDLFKVGAMDEITHVRGARRSACLRIRPEDILRIRLANYVSQAVFNDT